MPILPATIRFGRFSLFPHRRELLDGSQVCTLGARAFDLLLLLVQRQGDMVSKDDILDQVWAGLVVEENNIQVQISGLRKLLGREAILTVPGRGYRFTVPVRMDAAPVTEQYAYPAVPLPLIHPLGREREIASLQAMLGSQRLVTVLGPGGVGKTTLVQTVLAHQTPALWVDLSTVRTSGMAGLALAQALGIELSPGGLLGQSLAAAVAYAQRLLVLDNAEHQVAELTPLVHDVLSRVPGARVLVTSQVPLRLPGEALLPLGGLPRPQAAAMFRERAQLLQPDSVSYPEDLLDAICAQLDDNPLAIEMAVARLPIWGLAGLRRRLDNALQALGAPHRMAAERQSSLRSVLDWSVQLLTPAERDCFTCLSAFLTPFSLEDAQSLVRDAGLDPWQMLDSLSTLVERSLVYADLQDPPHYLMRDSVRQFGRELLAQPEAWMQLLGVVAWFEQAGERWLAMQSFAAALDALACAVDLIDGVAGAEPRLLALLLKQGPVMQTVFGPSDPACGRLYARAAALAEHEAPGPAGFEAAWGHWHYLAMSGANHEAALACEALLRTAALLDDPDSHLEACHAAVSTHQLLGHLDQVLVYGERALQHYRFDTHSCLAHRFGGHDPGICVAGQSILAAAMAAREDGFMTRQAALLEWMARTPHPYSRAVGQFYHLIYLAVIEDWDSFVEWTDKFAQLAEQAGMDLLQAEAQFLSAKAADVVAPSAQARTRMDAALADLIARSDLAFIHVYSCLLAASLLGAGEPGSAEAVLQRSLQLGGTAQACYAAEVWRLLARARRMAGDIPAAEQALARAQVLAQEQGASRLLTRILHDRCNA